MSKAPEETGTAIAVIGMAGRFPGARSLDAFWRNLCESVESIRFFTDEELSASGVDLSLLATPSYVKARGVLGDIDLFDAELFGFTPREAEITDPQHRLFLECSWEALESAGYAPGNCKEVVGVYGGTSLSLYLARLYSDPVLIESIGSAPLEIGNDKDHLATRVSYKLDLRGPSLTVQTGCSTSLVAVHLAVQSLLGYECDMALAGGVSITLPEARGYFHQEGGIASPDGHCRAFDAEARGTVSGNGVGIVVLKRLQDAVNDGDFIYAVIRGTAINNDGAGKAGYTAPGVAGQARVIREALAVAQCHARDISYIEAHGTGTVLGDPVEMAALRKAFGSSEGKAWCAVGSVKTNIGHLNAAAGIAGLIKTVCMLKNRQIPASLNFSEPNPEIDFHNSPFYINAALKQWSGDAPRRAGVSSFSIGGTNAHVVLEEAPPAEPGGGARQNQLLVFSAKTIPALEKMTESLASELERRPDSDLADVAYTLHVGREAFPHRRMLVASSSKAASEALRSLEPGKVIDGNWDGGYRPIVFLFPGQASGLSSLGSRLYQMEHVFRREINLCSEILLPHLGLDLRGLLGEELVETSVVQPALFAFEIALARLWMTWGVQPAAMLGHSLGEYVAACVAGVFDLEQALLLVVERGRLMQAQPPGAMLAVALPEDGAKTLLEDGLDLAAVNGPSACVISGAPTAIDSLEARLFATGVACRRLATDKAFHSSLIEPAVQPLIERLASMTLRVPQIPFLSNVTGTWIRPEEATDPQYWGRHLRETVHFSRGLDELSRDPGCLLLEVGPGSTLSRLARRHPGFLERSVIAWRPDGEREVDLLLMETLGRLWSMGVGIDWAAVHTGWRRRRLPLPTYPFERRRCWIEPRSEAEAVTPPGSPREQATDSLKTAHARRDLSTTYVPPGDEVEDAIAKLMCELFGFDRIGVEDNFFELGGHSLLAVQAVNRLRLLFGIELPMSALFEAPTIGGLARKVRAIQLGPLEETEQLESLLQEIERLSANETRVAIERELVVPPPGFDTKGLLEEASLRFSLFFFSGNGTQTHTDKYHLLFESARFADRHGFEAVWTPERHFQGFGGLYPNPSVLSAALAARTQRIGIRAGSLVLPLHNPIRVAEDWSLLDNLSGGRVGISLASGWHPSDFALSPEAYGKRREVLLHGIEMIRQLWSGGTLKVPGGAGEEVEVSLLPRPLSSELPIWLTSSGSLETWVKAGEIGANILTGFLDDLEQRIAIYRRARAEKGYNPASGCVTVMLHTFVGEDLTTVKKQVEGPMLRYLRTFAGQSRSLYPQGAEPTAEELDDLAAFGFEGYFNEGSLLGTPETCMKVVDRLRRAGVDEVACLIDFGLDEEVVLGGLELLNVLRERVSCGAADATIHPEVRVV